MAHLFPFSQRTAERLKSMPGAGGTHKWLAQIACGLRQVLPPEKCLAFLRRCCDEFVKHREIPNHEIEAAVEFAYADHSGNTNVNFGRRTIDWPEPNPDLINRIMATVVPIFDGETSTKLQPKDVLPILFHPGELVCAGSDSEHAIIRPIEDTLVDAEMMQFICVNPMRGPSAINNSGKPSVRCQNNVTVRRFIVAEFDDVNLSKRHQAQLSTALADMAPLVIAVHSGAKSIHAWYAVESVSKQDQARFFAVACLLGADSTRWDNSGWLRAPGGLRKMAIGNYVRQRILYFNPSAVAETKGRAP